MNFETSRIGKKVIEFKDVSFAFENKPILQDFNLLVQNKDRIGIVGDNGVGKSTLLNLIAERLQPQSGQVIIGETVRVAYFSQQIDGLDESKRVINFLNCRSLGAISFPTFHARNLDRKTLRWGEETPLSLKTLD